MYCIKCGKEVGGRNTICEKCGKKINSVENNQKNNSSKRNNSNNKNYKKQLILGIVAIIAICILGGLFAFKYFFNSKDNLNIQIENIAIDNYPVITTKLKKISSDSSFNKDSINLYEENKQIEEYTIVDISDGFELTYISRETRKDEVKQNLKIENKHNTSDFVEKTYVKPNQQSLNLSVSQVDSNNFPEVSLYFTAKDELGNIVKNLSSENLNIFTKNKSGESISTLVKNFNFIDKKEPVSISMVMDTSDSMMSQLSTCQRTANDFINRIDFNIGDKVSIIEFNNYPKINNYFTSNKESLINSINGLRTDGQTALYDALIMSLNETNRENGVKCIIAFTDGDDNKSKSTPTDVINLSKKLNIPVYIIGLGGSLNNSALLNITNNTLGEYININNIGELNSIYTNILKKTKEQYVLTYDSINSDDLFKEDISLNVNSYMYKGEKYHQYDIKPKEYRVDIKNYDKLMEDIKIEAENTLGKIKGKYSVSFKDINKGNMLSLKSEKVISASTIKIFIMIEAFDRINTGKLSEDEILTLQDNMKVGGSGILSGKPAGTKLSIKELITLMMDKSDNVAANMLIDRLGMDNINNRIKYLGCINSEINRKMMDQGAIDRGIQNYTSTYDLALVLTKLYNGQCVNKTYDTKMIDIMKNNESKSKIPNKLPSNVKVANKSGEFTGVENDAGIVFTDNGAYILTITTTDGNSGEQVNAISNLSKFVYDKYMASY